MVPYFHKHFLIILAVVLYGCRDNNKKEGVSASSTINDSISAIEKQTQVTELLFYSNELKKFSFENYRQQICFIKGPPKSPDLSQLKDLPEDILSRIKEDYQENNPNFNCKFKVLSWTCGSPCQMVAIFDSETGKIIKTFTTSFGVKYKLESRLLISDPPMDTPMDENYRKAIGEPVYWEIIDGQLQKIQ